MGRKKRHTAKTGDKGLYKNRLKDEDAVPKHDSDDDDMHDKVDRFHNEREQKRDMLRFDKSSKTARDSDDEDDDGIVTGREGVFDLGIGASSSEEGDSSEDDDSDSSDEEENGKSSSDASSSVDDSDDDDDDSDDEMDENGDSILDWGSKKRDYYDGDAAGNNNNEEDAILEEEAGKEVQKLRYDAMEEDDFLTDFDATTTTTTDTALSKNKKEEKKKGNKSSSTSFLGGGNGLFAFQDDTGVEQVKANRNSQKVKDLSVEDKLRLLASESPELLPLLSHFKTGAISELKQTVLTVAEQLSKQDQAEAVGATPNGLLYLKHKQMMQLSTALNLCMYLLMKCENNQDNNNNIRNHPVISRLNELNESATKLNIKVEEPFGVLNQLDSLAKAAALMVDGDEEEEDETSSDGSTSEGEDSIDKQPTAANKEASDSMHDDDNDDSSSSSVSEDESEGERDALNEARFAVCAQDIDNSSKLSSKTRNRRKTKKANNVRSKNDFGDDDDETSNDVLQAGKKLSATMNLIAQKEQTQGRRRAAPTMTGDDEEDEAKRFQRGLAMMEADIGKISDHEEEDEDDNNMDHELESEDEFYKQTKHEATMKKQIKKSMYEVKPKYPGMEQEVTGERAAGRMIMKNRGLVPHKSKLNRNPRVKKREQYRKALIRRKGAVREVRTEEGDGYGGEKTGIKSSISRSRKIGGVR